MQIFIYLSSLYKCLVDPVLNRVSELKVLGNIIVSCCVSRQKTASTFVLFQIELKMKKSSVGDLNKTAEGSWQEFLKSLNFPGGRRGKGKT